MNRRSFLGALAAAVVAPWLPKVAKAENPHTAKLTPETAREAERQIKYRLYGGARGDGKTWATRMARHEQELDRIALDYPAVKVMNHCGQRIFAVYDDQGNLCNRVQCVLYSGDFIGHVKIERPENHPGYIYAWQTFEHEGGMYATVEWDPAALESHEFRQVLRGAAVSVTEMAPAPQATIGEALYGIPYYQRGPEQWIGLERR